MSDGLPAPASLAMDRVLPFPLVLILFAAFGSGANRGRGLPEFGMSRLRMRIVRENLLRSAAPSETFPGPHLRPHSGIPTGCAPDSASEPPATDTGAHIHSYRRQA